MTYIDVLDARGSLIGALDALRTIGGGLPSVQGQDLAALAVELSELMVVARGALVATTAEAKTRGVVLESGSRTPAQWLVDAGAAVKHNEAALIARAIDATTPASHASLRDGMTSGEVTPGDAITAAECIAELFGATEPATHDAIVEGAVQLARGSMSRRDLREFHDEMLARFGTRPSEDREHEHQQSRRAVTAFRPLADGMWRLEATLPPADKAIVDAALTALAAPSPDPDTGARDLRTAGQRRADALVAAFARVAGLGETGPLGASTQVALILPIEALHRACEHQARDSFGRPLPGQDCDCERPVAGRDELGTTLLPQDTRLLACGADLTRVYVGKDGQPLVVGRTERTAKPWQRTALCVRDRGCTFPGCQSPPSWSQAHHITHWADGGATDLDNLALVCHYHHTFIHHHDITGRVTPDGTRVEWDVTRVGASWRPRPPESSSSGPLPHEVSPPDVDPPDPGRPDPAPRNPEPPDPGEPGPKHHLTA